jgi:hypothetical protein
VRTDELIIRLASTADPVVPLDPPSIRMARWISMAMVGGVVGALLIGLRPDIAVAIHRSMFVGLAAVTCVTAVLSASAAFVLSVPGAERSALQRTLPIGVGLLWMLVLVVALTSTDDPFGRIVTMRIHLACPLEITGFGALAGWPLFVMLRRAAPLRHGWSAALAVLAATALGALATQLVCPLDDPAHHLFQHVVPVALLSAGAAIVGSRRDIFRSV